jgi:hypothetical protein
MAGIDDVILSRKYVICYFKGWTQITFFATNKMIFKAAIEDSADWICNSKTITSGSHD